MLRVLSLCAAIIKDKTTVTSTAQRPGGVNDLLSDMGHVLVANSVPFIAKQTCISQGEGILQILSTISRKYMYTVVRSLE